MQYETAKPSNRALVAQTLSNTMTMDETTIVDGSTIEHDERHDIISIENQQEPRGRASSKKEYQPLRFQSHESNGNASQKRSVSKEPNIYKRSVSREYDRNSRSRSKEQRSHSREKEAFNRDFREINN